MWKITQEAYTEHKAKKRRKEEATPALPLGRNSALF